MVGIAISFLSPMAAFGIYTFVAIMWLIPDSRIENAMKEPDNKNEN
jgi:hypothetical protein